MRSLYYHKTFKIGNTFFAGCKGKSAPAKTMVVTARAVVYCNKKAFCSQNARAERGCDSNNFLTRDR